jgi:hypothetical protein
MDQMSTTLEAVRRRALFAEVQHIMASEVPVLCDHHAQKRRDREREP